MNAFALSVVVLLITGLTLLGIVAGSDWSDRGCAAFPDGGQCSDALSVMVGCTLAGLFLIGFGVLAWRWL